MNKRVRFKFANFVNQFKRLKITLQNESSKLVYNCGINRAIAQDPAA